MTIKIVISVSESEQGGADFSYKATPYGEPGDDEIKTANTIVALCDLLSEDDFIDHIKPWVERKLHELHTMQEGGFSRNSSMVQ